MSKVMRVGLLHQKKKHPKHLFPSLLIPLIDYFPLPHTQRLSLNRRVENADGHGNVLEHIRHSNFHTLNNIVEIGDESGDCYGKLRNGVAEFNYYEVN